MLKLKHSWICPILMPVTIHSGVTIKLCAPLDSIPGNKNLTAMGNVTRQLCYDTISLPIHNNGDIAQGE